MIESILLTEATPPYMEYELTTNLLLYGKYMEQIRALANICNEYELYPTNTSVLVRRQLTHSSHTHTRTHTHMSSRAHVYRWVPAERRLTNTYIRTRTHAHTLSRTNEYRLVLAEQELTNM